MGGEASEECQMVREEGVGKIRILKAAHSAYKDTGEEKKLRER